VTLQILLLFIAVAMHGEMACVHKPECFIVA